MTINQIRKLHRAQPFQPFRMHLADGRAVEITHPELLAINEPGRTVVVATQGVFEIIDLLLVTSVEVANGKPRSKRQR